MELEQMVSSILMHILPNAGNIAAIAVSCERTQCFVDFGIAIEVDEVTAAEQVPFFYDERKSQFARQSIINQLPHLERTVRRLFSRVIRHPPNQYFNTTVTRSNLTSFHPLIIRHHTFPNNPPAKMGSNPKSPSIKVNNLTFAFPDGSTGLQNISLDLPAGSRTLLIGGKSSHSATPINTSYTEC